MASREKAEAERLKHTDEDVKRALEQTGGKALKEEEAVEEEAKSPPRAKRHKLWIGSYVLMLFALIARGVFFSAARSNQYTASLPSTRVPSPSRYMRPSSN